MDLLALIERGALGALLIVLLGAVSDRMRPYYGALLASIPILGLKLFGAGAVLALIETVSAKLRIFRAPEFLATAFLFAVLGLLVHLLLGA